MGWDARDWAPGIGGGVAAGVGAAAVLTLAWWLAAPPPEHLAPRLPLAAHDADAVTLAGAPAEFVDLRGTFRSFGGAPSALRGAWPRFRGAGFDNVAADPAALAERWPAGGPPVLWSVDLGEGHAGPAVRNGRVYVLDYDEREESDTLRCFSLDDGRELWRRWYRTRAKRNHGVSRTVPAVTDRHVVTIGPRCHVLCVDALTGEFRWGVDLVRQYGAKEPLWYTAQHPLIDGDLVILAPAGRSLLVAVDVATGRVAWETPNPRGWQMSHASVVPVTFGGRRMYVYAAIGGMAGVAADGERPGEVLWETGEWNNPVTAPSPVDAGGGRLFVTAGYGVGSALFQLRAEGGRFRAALAYRLTARQFACEQQTPVFYRGHLFGVMPKDGGALRQQVVCLRPDGTPAWASGKEHQFGLGPYLVADGKLLLLNDDGVLTVARADPAAYEPLARAKLLDGRDAWAPMALVSGRLLLRDSRRMICVDLRPAASAPRRAAGAVGGKA